MNSSKRLEQFPHFHRRSSGAWSLLVFLLLLWGSGSAPVADAALLTFDDLPAADGTPIPGGYGGLQWSNFFVLNAVTYGQNPSGYHAGMISLSNVAYNAFGAPAHLFNANPFNLGSGYFTGAWNDGLQLEVKGWIGLALAYDHTYTLSATTPLFIDFSYAGVTSVDFISSGGTQHPGYNGSGTHFVMDDLMVTNVPEPSAMVLLLVALPGFGISACCRRGRRV